MTAALPDQHFFRRESGRLVSTLTRMLGPRQVALAEDAVQETLAAAVEIWAFRGVPDNPSAWLMTAARNRAVSLLRRERTAHRFAPELGRQADAENAEAPDTEEVSLPPALRDDELRMMFSCCHPDIPEDAQIALVLSLLGGFSAQEVAGAFLVSRAAMEKRLTRAKKVLSSSRSLFELGARDFETRLAAVRRALYLLFNEGYHGACPDAAVRLDLCREAMRLVALLVEHGPSASPATHALAALMALGAARLPARVNEAGDLTELSRQDRSRWDATLIARGLRLLETSARGEVVSEYHLEAAIAATHALAPSAEETPWGDIVELYDALMRIRPSPVVALNRAVAVAEQLGPERGLEALRSIPGAERLAAYPFYPAALGELELRRGHVAEARRHLRAAHRLARNPTERGFLERRLAECDRQTPPPAGEIKRPSSSPPSSRSR
ncbi:MAG TPA: sigma-70 family RNA polymerase sigma factor [Myxococcaceae bacterium]